GKPGGRAAGAHPPSGALLGTGRRAEAVRAARAGDRPAGQPGRQGVGARRRFVARTEEKSGDRHLADAGPARAASRRAHQRHGARGRGSHRRAGQEGGAWPHGGAGRAQHGRGRAARRPHHGAGPRADPGGRHLRGDQERRARDRGVPGRRGAGVTAPLLEVSDLDAWYGQAQALHKVHLTVAPGECVALIGRNGAGKTTTLRSIMGVLRKKTGTIRFRGQDILKLDSHEIARRGIAYVPEERAIFATLSVKENLELPPVWQKGGWTARKCYEAFPALEARGEHSGAKLSGGEQQMLAIA